MEEKNDPAKELGPRLILLVILILTLTALFAMLTPKDKAREPGVEVREAWLGANVRSTELAGRNAVRVQRPLKNSPAVEGGLRSGDIIVGFAGLPVWDADQLGRAVRKMRPGDRVQISVWRDKDLIRLPVILGIRPKFALNITAVLVILSVVFFLLFKNLLDRVVVVGIGAATAVIIGTYLGFYDENYAFSSINLNTLTLLLGMGLISAVLETAGFFDLVARKIIAASEGNKFKLMVLLCVATFLLSTFVNNLTTILVMVPMTMRLAAVISFDPKPFVICEIISSNLGGASSMVGDFPNMLIASSVDLYFRDFLIFMMPVCILLLSVTILYIKKIKPEFFQRGVSRTYLAGGAISNHSGQSGKVGAGKDEVLMKKALGVLVLVVFGFLLSGTLNLKPSTIAILGGFGLLLIGRVQVKSILKKVGFGDILFFSFLFVLVGAVDASGLLNFVGYFIADFCAGSTLAVALLLMWIAAFVTCFLSAGPTTAIFIPIVMSLGIASPHNLFWWALSLGVCAGSSATITGATAGPVALSKFEDFLQKNNSADSLSVQELLTFKEYAKVGIPLAIFFLVISSIYVAIISVL